jgi:peptidoglycan/xylan/chitin deacetylase (PgdA/CDA1 family)
MRRGGGVTALRIAAYVVLICAMLFSLMAFERISDLNRSLRARIDVLNEQVALQQAEISRLNEWIAGSAGSPADVPELAEADAHGGVSGVWEPAPPKLFVEYRDYQELYPELYTARPERFFTQDKTVYLTFDDGPSAHTERVLNILKEKNVKAAFFIVGDSVTRLGEYGEALLSRMIDEGHTVGVHCNTHVYDRVYASVEAFLVDFNEAHTLIKDITGVNADIFRFPGGSVNNHNGKIRTDLIDEMTRRGFTYYDWNASTGDTARNASEESALRNATLRAGKSNRVVILMHDTKEVSVRALSDIIDTYRSMGYSFERLRNTDKPIIL